MASYKDQSVTLVEFDFTSDSSKAKSIADAKTHGLSEVYESHAPNTGFVLIVDGKTKKVLGKLKASHTVDDWKVEIDKALKSS